MVDMIRVSSCQITVLTQYRPARSAANYILSKKYIRKSSLALKLTELQNKTIKRGFRGRGLKNIVLII